MPKRPADWEGPNCVCEICGHVSTHAGNHRIHVRTHSTLKPYVCGYCGAKTAEKCDLTRHILACHPGAEIKAYTCICRYTTTDVFAFKTHTEKKQKQCLKRQRTLKKLEFWQTQLALDPAPDSILLPIGGVFGIGLHTAVPEKYVDDLAEFTLVVMPLGYVNISDLHLALHLWLRYRMFTEEQLAGKGDTDHINGNLLDNCRLRPVTHLENCRNTATYSMAIAGAKGVYFGRNSVIPHAKITVNKKKINLGSFNTIREAALAYNAAATHHFGEFARLNPIV